MCAELGAQTYCKGTSPSPHNISTQPMYIVIMWVEWWVSPSFYPCNTTSLVTLMVRYWVIPYTLPTCSHIHHRHCHCDDQHEDYLSTPSKTKVICSTKDMCMILAFGSMESFYPILWVVTENKSTPLAFIDHRIIHVTILQGHMQANPCDRFWF
jgi:hypothetical protein